MLKAGFEDGDWRALSSLVDRVHGRPVERVEKRDVGEAAEMPLLDLRRLRQQLLDRHPELRLAE